MWTAPPPSQSTLADSYKSRYREARHEILSDEHLAYKDARAVAQRAFILAHTSPSLIDRRRLLDIGCAAGSLLRSLGEQWPNGELVGFEPDLRMAAAARARLPARAVVHDVVFESSKVDNEGFDLITASHILEHVPNPVVFLSDLWNSTRPGGLLFLEVPHETTSSVKEIVKARHRGLMHLLFFSMPSLGDCVRQAGWDTLYMSTFGPDVASFSIVPTRYASWPKRLRFAASRIKRRFRRQLGLYEADSNSVDWVAAYSRESAKSGIWIRLVAERSAAGNEGDAVADDASRPGPRLEGSR